MLLALATGLAGRGWDVDVVSLAGTGEIGAILESRGIGVTALEASGSRDLRVIGKLAGFLRERRPEILFSILIHANLAASMASRLLQTQDSATAAAIQWVQSIHTVQERPRWHWVTQGMILSDADLFIAPSRAVLEKVKRYGPLGPAAVIPNGIDVRRFFEAQPIDPDKRPWPRDADGKPAFVVGYIGRFDRVKRLDLLIRAVRLLLKSDAARFGELHVALVGYGPMEQRLRMLAAELELTPRVHFLGATDEPERWYKAFDVFCSPSAAEGFGLTLAEATAAGIPVIACRTPAVMETLDSANWLPSEPDPGDVARSIQEVHRKGKGNPRPLDWLQTHYSQEVMISRYAEILAALAEK